VVTRTLKLPKKHIGLGGP